MTLITTVVLAGLAGSACHGGGARPEDTGPPAAYPGMSGKACPEDADRRGSRRLVILHTNDLHAHLNGHGPERDYSPATADDDGTIGGFARLGALIARERSRARSGGASTLLLDAGDFSMGTLFELLGTAQAPELKLMDALGYDATTLGNHEFDYTPQGLATMLKARGLGWTTPVLASNIVFDRSSPADDDLFELADYGRLPPKLIKHVDGLRVGIFGLMGSDAVKVTPTMKPVTFEDISVAAARVVAELRGEDKVDLVIALSHSGIGSDGRGEDADLAAKVPGIDVIISGHTHATLAAPARVGQTLIVTAGANGSHLGRLELQLSGPPGQMAASLCSYELLPVDDRTRGDPDIQAQVDSLAGAVDGLLGPAGLTYRSVVAETGTDLARRGPEEWPVGNLVTDAYRAVVSALQPDQPPAVALDANGQIRAPLLAGKTGQVWFADMFRVLPLGLGPDGQPGFPLVTFFITPRELKAGLELSAAAEVVGGDAFQQVSGIEAEFDSSRPPFTRVAAIKLVRPDGSAQPLDLSDGASCLKVTTTFLVGAMLGLVESATGGALSVKPKAEDCQTPITDLATRIVDRDPATPGVQELKHWQALARFVGTLPDTDGDEIPNIPARYGAAQDRIVRR
jgi:5'-nucleotidase